MKNEFLVLAIVLMKSMGAFAEGPVPTRISEIPPEVQKCLILAAAPADRLLLQMVLDNDCFMQLSDVEKQKAIQILKSVGNKNFGSIPLMS